MNYIIGVDIGTTNTKAVAYNYSGAVLAQASRTYIPITPQEGYHELDPDILFDAVCQVIHHIASRNTGYHLGGISFSAAMHGLIAVDKNGRPLTNMITWADLRSSAYARALKGTDTGARLHEMTGTPVHAMSPFCKLMWMREQDTVVFHAAAKFISIKEYVFHKFFGRYIVDHSVASSTGLFDIRALTWEPEALHLAGISRDRLSDLVPSSHVVVGLKKEISERIAVEPEVPFIIGGSDGCMAHIGSNALKPGDVSLTIGTSGAIRVMNDKPLKDPDHRIFNYIIADNLFLSGGPVNNGGNVLQWFSRNFLYREFHLPAEIEEFIEQALQVPAGSDGLVFLPYIYGERAPVWDADARGIFFGVSSTHTLSHFMRAAMEGISFSLLSILKAVESVAGGTNDIYASGGFIRSRRWVQMLANILGKELHVTHAEDSSAAGAAILGLQSLGVIGAWEEAPGFFDATEIYRPDMEEHALYRGNYDVYSNLYDKFCQLKN